MRRFRLAALAVALAAVPAAGQEPDPKPVTTANVVQAGGIRIRGDLRAAEFRLVKLTATGHDKESVLIWDVQPEASADVLEVDDGLVFTGPAGTYTVKLTAVSVKDRKRYVTRATVVIGTSPPGPNPPNPGPNPPGPPPPADPLLSPVRAMLGADQSPTKLADAAALAAVYRSLADTGVPDQRVRTAGDLAAVVSAARAARIGDRLAAVRDVFGGEFERAVPAEPAAVLSADTKAAAVALFKRFATVLEAAVKP